MSSIARVVNAIHSETTRKGAIYAAGGGLGVFGMLGGHGGASATLLSCRVPYTTEDFVEVLGGRPDRFVDTDAARQLAAAAFAHALRIRGDLDPRKVFGIGCSSKLSTGTNERAGRSHEIHACLVTSLQTTTKSVRLPGGPDRAFEEHINALLILNLIADAKGCDAQVDLDGYACTEYRHVVPDTASSNPDPRIERVLLGEGPFCALGSAGDDPEVGWGSAFYPGSWRPIHDGHREIRRLAQKILAQPVVFELSLTNPDKPPLDHLTIEERFGKFDPGDLLVLTDAPTFIAKARLFPDSTFVMGSDTAARFFDPKYYGRESDRDRMLDEAESLGMRLLVFGRIDPSGIFRQVLGVTHPPRVLEFLSRNVELVPEEVFRRDISSTEIRRQEVGAKRHDAPP